MLQTDCLDLLQIHFGPEPQKVLVGSKQAKHLRRNLELLETEMDEALVERALQIG